MQNAAHCLSQCEDGIEDEGEDEGGLWIVTGSERLMAGHILHCPVWYNLTHTHFIYSELGNLMYIIMHLH